jgi:hypothetical protein
MPTALQLRRGTTTQHGTFTGAAGEVSVDTTKNTAVVHNGSTAGGFPLARENLSNVPANSVTTTMLADGSVTTAKLADGAVATVDIANLAVTTAKIADANVTTAKIADANVTSAKLENSGVTAGTYGSASSIPVVTVDAKGRVTAASTVAITSSAPTTAQVLSATAGASAGAVGTYGFFNRASNNYYAYPDYGGTMSGSLLIINSGSSTVAGTWRAMSQPRYISTDSYGTTYYNVASYIFALRVA